MFSNFIISLVQLSVPFAMKELISFIEDKDDEYSLGYGITFIAIIAMCQLFITFSQIHLGFMQQRMGLNASNALISLIYDKIQKISSATNKKHKKGDIINFISVDARKLVFLSEQLPICAKFPFQLVIAIVLLFYFFGLGFFSGLAIIIFSIITNFYLAKLTGYLQQNIMKAKDIRMN